MIRWVSCRVCARVEPQRTTSPHFGDGAEMLPLNMEVDMLIEEIRRTPAKVLTEEQREAYWNNGFPACGDRRCR